MQLAMIGLGRMGGNMVRRLLQGGHEVVVYDRSAEVIQTHVQLGAKGARDLADTCRQHVGPAGAGHYVKMVHNGIEYGMLQAYAEGYEILHASKDFKLNLCDIANLWNHGSVVRSWLNELAARAFEKDANLGAIKGFVEDSGEGRWTVEEAMHLDVPAPVITLSLLTRFRSRQPESFGAKVVAALRNEFGGHAVKST